MVSVAALPIISPEEEEEVPVEVMPAEVPGLLRPTCGAVVVFVVVVVCCSAAGCGGKATATCAPVPMTVRVPKKSLVAVLLLLLLLPSPAGSPLVAPALIVLTLTLSFRCVGVVSTLVLCEEAALLGSEPDRESGLGPVPDAGAAAAAEGVEATPGVVRDIEPLERPKRACQLPERAGACLEEEEVCGGLEAVAAAAAAAAGTGRIPTGEVIGAGGVKPGAAAFIVAGSSDVGEELSSISPSVPAAESW